MMSSAEKRSPTRGGTVYGRSPSEYFTRPPAQPRPPKQGFDLCGDLQPGAAGPRAFGEEVQTFAQERAHGPHRRDLERRLDLPEAINVVGHVHELNLRVRRAQRLVLCPEEVVAEAQHPHPAPAADDRPDTLDHVVQRRLPALERAAHPPQRHSFLRPLRLPPRPQHDQRLGFVALEHNVGARRRDLRSREVPDPSGPPRDAGDDRDQHRHITLPHERFGCGNPALNVRLQRCPSSDRALRYERGHADPPCTRAASTGNKSAVPPAVTTTVWSRQNPRPPASRLPGWTASVIPS